MPSSYETLLARKMDLLYAQTLPTISPRYRGMWLYTYTPAWAFLIQRARTLGYVQHNALNIKGFSHMLDDIAQQDLTLLDKRPAWLTNPPFQDHFLGTGNVFRVKICPKPSTLNYLATWAHDHYILPKRNYASLGAHAGIVIHLMGRGYVVPAEWPTYSGRHGYKDPNANISDSYTRTRSLSSPAASY